MMTKIDKKKKKSDYDLEILEAKFEIAKINWAKTEKIRLEGGCVN